MVRSNTNTLGPNFQGNVIGKERWKSGGVDSVEELEEEMGEGEEVKVSSEQLKSKARY